MVRRRSPQAVARGTWARKSAFNLVTDNSGQYPAQPKEKTHVERSANISQYLGRRSKEDGCPAAGPARGTVRLSARRRRPLAGRIGLAPGGSRCIHELP